MITPRQLRTALFVHAAQDDLLVNADVIPADALAELSDRFVTVRMAGQLLRQIQEQETPYTYAQLIQQINFALQRRADLRSACARDTKRGR